MDQFSQRGQKSENQLKYPQFKTKHWEDSLKNLEADGLYQQRTTLDAAIVHLKQVTCVNRHMDPLWLNNEGGKNINTATF